MSTVWNAMKSDDKTPYMIGEVYQLPSSRRDCIESGATPSRKPTVTMSAAPMTRIDGMERVCIEETVIVSGRTIPRAIYSM